MMIAETLAPEKEAPATATRSRLAVILPVWNEATVIVRSIEAVVVFSRTHPEYDFTFVDDGSDDGTAAILTERLSAAADGNLSLIAHSTHRGKGLAVRSALASCDAECVCFIDGDLAYSLDQLILLESALESADIVIGNRFVDRASASNPPPLRQVLSQCFNRLVRSVLHLPHSDTQAGFKGFRAPVARHLFGLQRIEGLGFDAELLFLARKFGYTVAEMPVQVGPEHRYKTSSRKLLRNSLLMLIDVLGVCWNDLAARYR